MNKWRVVVLGVVLSVGVGAVFLRLGREQGLAVPDVGEIEVVRTREQAAAVTAVQDPVVSHAVASSEPTASHTVAPGVAESPTPDATVELADERTPEEPPEVTAAKLDALTGLLPAWMIDSGDRFQDRREISGHTVYRSRSRYKWDNGSSMEIEITDAGPDADEGVVKALGFNPLHCTTNTIDGFTLTCDDGDVLMNQEYDYNDQGGNLQLMVDGRYLVEIQLQQLPLDSFLTVLDQQLSLDELRLMIEQ